VDGQRTSSAMEPPPTGDTTTVPVMGGSLGTGPDGCPTCGHPTSQTPAAPSRSRSIYAVGRLSPQFPSIGVEKEFIQLAGATEHRGPVERELLPRVLGEPDNRYLGRHLCWVFTAQHVDAFVVTPREGSDVGRLVDMVSSGSDDVLHVVIGSALPVGTDSPCSGLGIPLVVAEQFFAFTLEEFIEALFREQAPGQEPLASTASQTADRAHHDDHSRAVVRDVFLRLTRRADNLGIADEHRALNYLALRYPALYHMALQAFLDGKTLVGVDVRHNYSLSRVVVSVRLTFRHRRDELVERYHCLVDVTEVFPFLASPLTLVYD
jgi:hypothetical protein